MTFFPSHQRKENRNLFGLLPSRFLFKGPSKAPHKIPDDEVSAAQKEAKEKYQDLSKQLKEHLDAYNAKYGEKPDDGGEDVHYERIDFSLENIPAMRAQIQSIKRAMQEEAGDAWPTVLKENPQWKRLQELLLILKELPKYKAKLAETVVYAHRGRLAERHEMMRKAGEKKELWRKRPAYEELSGVFDTLVEHEDFKDVWQTPEGLAGQKQREAKELFFAMMAEKTNGFKSSFVLGDTFGNDPEENIRNFPFIYEEFLKHEGHAVGDNVSVDQLKNAQAAAQEADNKLIGIGSAEDIIKRNSAETIASQTLGPDPSMPDTEAWIKRAAVLNSMVHKLREKAKQNPDLPQKKGWEKAADDLSIHLARAEAYLQLSRLKDRETLVRSKFTRAELSTPPRRKLIMELAMRKFVKAMDMIDSPMGNANWHHTLHPTVRRMLIASVYDGGVATYEEDAEGNITYNDNLKGHYTWMASTLALSDYFNFKEVGEQMDRDHEALLKATFLGSKIAVLLERFKPTEEVLQAWLEIRQAREGEQAKLIQEKLRKFHPSLRKRFEKYTAEELQKTIGEVATNRQKLEEFLKRTREAVKDPYSKESQKFIADMKADTYKTEIADDISNLGEIGVIDDATLHAYEAQMNNLQINFKTAELQDKNDLMFFEGLGMNIEGLEPKYLEAIKNNPKLKVEYWDDLFMGSDAEFNSLIGLLTQIIPDSAAGGKEDFIVGMKSLRQKYLGVGSLTKLNSQLEDGSEDMVVLNVFRMLQLHLKSRAKVAAFEDMKAKEVASRLRGMHIGDKLTKYVGGVWEMLTGPGQSMANRAAGLVLMYGFYKAARKAMKGEGKSGKALRALFVAGAVEIAAKEITGRGVLDRLGLDSIAGAMEGTYEAVLQQDAAEDFEKKEIPPEAHLASLTALNGAPFHQVMEWYESSDDNGMPRNKKGPDKLPGGLNRHLNTIASKMGIKEDGDVLDKKMAARRVLFETVKHFFSYVGEKDNKRGHDHGKEALKERWVKMVDDPDYKPKFSSFTHREWMKAGGITKKDITWQMVMRSEISVAEVDLTHGKTPVGKLEATAKEWGAEINDFVLEYVLNPSSGHAQIFFEKAGEKAQDAKRFFSEVAETSQRQIYFTKERAVLWYGEHQYEIKRVAENHWALLVTAVKMPFKVIYAVDGAAVPWSLVKLKQIEESLRTDKWDSTDIELDARHITTTTNQINSPNEKLNPKFTYFGVHQMDFLNALTDPTDRRQNKPKPWFHENPNDRVGYFISEVTAKEAGVSADDPVFSGDPGNVRSKMLIKAREKAKQQFRKQGMSLQEIDDYMDQIHITAKTTEPKKIYVFWRMPLKGSKELELKSAGRWADYPHAEQIKHRKHFEVYPHQSSTENLRRAFSMDMGPTRTIVSKMTKYAGQIPRFVLWNVAAAGTVLKGIGGLFETAGPEGRARTEKWNNAVKALTERPDGQLQMLDEVTTSAEGQFSASSAFYKDPINAKIFKFSLNFAHRKSQPLYTGLLENRTVDNPDGGDPIKHESTYYRDKPTPEVIDDMETYYNQEWKPANGEDSDIEAAIAEAKGGAAPEPATP